MKKRNYIFESCITVDNNFLIFQDNVYCLKENKNLGNIWSSIDKFKFIFSKIKINNPSYNIIRESIIKIPLLENHTNLYGLRDILLEFNFLQDTWLGREFSNNAKGIKDFVTNSYEGIKKFGVAISQGEWSNILNLLAKGTVYILRSLKDALYSTTGSIVDAMMLAILPVGSGKIAQFVPWTMVLGLDVYQWVNNDYNEEKSTFEKVIDIGFDVIGVLTSGVLAKRMKSLFEPLKKFGNNEKAIANEIKKSKPMMDFIQKILSGLSNIPKFFNNVISLVTPKFKKIGDFLKSMLQPLKNVLNSMSNVLSKYVVGNNIASKVIKTGGNNIASKALKSGAKESASSYVFGSDNKQNNGNNEDIYQIFKNTPNEYDINDI